MVRFAINGFGRIGKCILRALLENNNKELDCIVINLGAGDLENAIHLLKYDSTHGTLRDISIIDDSHVMIQGHQVKFLIEPDPTQIDWAKYGVDIVLECTGRFTTKALAMQHIKSGARKVLVSAPCDEADATIVLGVNEQILNQDHNVVSIGSCTTNCLAPLAKVINDNIGIEHGFMTTVHAYTNDQNLLDSNHKDLRRARAAALSMIPTSTGAAKALGLVIPELSGKLDGVAIRVPVHNVSMLELVFTAKRTTTAEELNKLVKDARSRVLDYVDEPLVSVDFTHNDASCIYDATQTRVVGNNLYRVVAWYDNEWGFANRMLDITKLIADK